MTTDETEARAKVTDELDRLRAVRDQLGQAFADATANVRRFVDVWTELVGDDPNGVVSSVWYDNDDAVYVTVGDLRALIDVDPRANVIDLGAEPARDPRDRLTVTAVEPSEVEAWHARLDGDEIGWHRRYALAEAARVRARGPGKGE